MNRPRAGSATTTDAPQGTGELHSLFDEGGVAPDAVRKRSPLSIEDVRIPTLLSGVYALILTVLLAILVRVAIPDSFLAQLFSHGWISFFTALLSVWAACILVLKARRIVFEKRALRFDVLSQEEDEVIRPTNVHRFTAHIQALPEKFRSSILFRRISRALEYFRSTGSPAGVSSYLASQNELDAAASDSSYTMVRAFIWAIPILGFIGTVFGIGEAVSSFAVSVDAAGEIEEIRNSLGGVTGGLGTAFETTLVALIMSIFLMIPMNWLLKTEDDLLTAIGSYCNEELIWRFERAPGSVGGVPPIAAPVGAPVAAPSGGAGAEALVSSLQSSVDGFNTSSHAALQRMEAVTDNGLESLAETSAVLGQVSQALGTDLPEVIGEYRKQVDDSIEASARLLQAQEDMRARFADAAQSESFESVLLKVNETHGRMMSVLEALEGRLLKKRRWWLLGH